MFNLGLLSKYRTELMGVATILIILCHMPAHGVVMPSFLKAVIVHGGTGCDMFLFLSGLGMYHSLESKKLTGGGILSWYRKRFARLMIPYLLICAPLFHVFAIREQWSIGQYFLRLSSFSFWTEGWGLWFVSLIIVLYLLTPFIDELLSGSYKWIWAIILVLCTWIIGSLSVPAGVLEHIQFCLCRVPCYILGFSLAPLVMEERQVRIAPFFAMVIVLYVVSQVIRKIFNIPVSTFWLEGVILLILSAYIIKWMKSESFVMKGLNFMGTISLESYCTNVFLLPFFLYVPWQIGGVNLNPGNWTYYLVGTLFCIVLSYWVNRISSRIIRNLF